MRPAYITSTRSAIRATTPKSWVIHTMANPYSSRNRATRARICCWIVTSSAVVGSSAISTEGRGASAAAISTRWRMPPDSWCGYSLASDSGEGSPTSPSTCRVRARASVADQPCAVRPSATWAPIRIMGFSEVIGSW